MGGMKAAAHRAPWDPAKCWAVLASSLMGQGPSTSLLAPQSLLVACPQGRGTATCGIHQKLLPVAAAQCCLALNGCRKLAGSGAEI